MSETQRKNSYRLEMKVAAEYLAEKFDEIVKKHTANPNQTPEISPPEQRMPPPEPEKLEKPKEIPPKTNTPKPRKCPNTVPRRQKPAAVTVISPPQRLKSNTILSKTINVNKQNLTVTMVAARQKKAKSQQQKPSNTNTNDLNLENLKKLDSQTIKTQVQNYEASSMMVNPSETQSLVEDKGDHVGNQAGDKSGFKKNSENQKKTGIRSKSANNQKENEEEPQVLQQQTQEVILEEPHLENHLEAAAAEERKQEKSSNRLEDIQLDLEEKSRALDARFFEVFKDK